jgi:hypothetical protein
MSLQSEEKPAFDSLTLRSVAAIAIAVAAGKAGVYLPDGAPQELAGSIFNLIATLGMIGVAVGRTRARAKLS